MHRPEFDELEWLAPVPGPHLPEQDGPADGDSDEDRQDSERHRKDDEADPSDDGVDETLDPAAQPPTAPLPHQSTIHRSTC
jgi:hypothetical protein